MIKFTTESTADLDYLLQQRDISALPLYVDLDGKTYLDGVDLDATDIFATYDQKHILPKTAARCIEDYITFFEGIKSSGAHEIVHIALSGELSASFSNATLAAAETTGVYVVDSRSLSTGAGLLVLKGQDLAAQGMSAADIADKLTELTKNVQASFVVDTMEYLHKGGRCSSLAKLVAGILKIKPMLLLREGKIVVGQKFSGSLAKTVDKYVDAILKQFNTPDYSRIFITHAHADPEIIDMVKAKIQSVAPDFKEIIETKAGCTVTSHCGKGTLGILYINQP